MIKTLGITAIIIIVLSAIVGISIFVLALTFILRIWKDINNDFKGGKSE